MVDVFGLSSEGLMMKASPFCAALPATVLDNASIYPQYCTGLFEEGVEMALEHDVERRRSQKTKKHGLNVRMKQQNASKASFITSRTDKRFYEHRKTCIL